MRGVATALTVVTAVLATAASAQAATLAIGPSRPCQLSGQKINMLGGGYTASSYVDIYLDGQSLGSLNTDAAGSLAGYITLRGLRGVKTHVVKAVDEVQPSVTAQTSFVGTTRQVTVKPQDARAGERLKLRGYGFLKRGRAYMHVRGHGLRTDSRVGKPKGACGTWAARRAIVPADATAGVYQVQFDQRRRYSRKTRPRVRGTMTVTRTVAGAPFAGAAPLYRWTRVG